MQSPESSQQELQQQVAAALGDASLPNIYFNGFITSLGNGDVLLILTRSGNNVAVLNASYTVIKTLASRLGTLIAEIESRSGNTIMTTDDIARLMGTGEAHDEDTDH